MSTLAQLRTRVRRNLGESTPGSSPRFDNASIDGHINEAYQQYQLSLIDNAQGDLATREPIDVVANQDLYPLPSTFVKTRKLWYVDSTGKYELEKSERRDWPVYQANAFNRQNYFTYRYLNRNILLEPAPLTSQTGGLLHEYYALQPILSGDSDSPVAGFIEAWQTMMVLDATIAELEGKEAIGTVVSIDTFRERLKEARRLFYMSMNKRSECNDTVQPDNL